MSDWHTPYSAPEKYGLLTVTEVEWYEPNYSFNMTAILWSPATKEYWWADDSGCSCPVPFEDMGKPEDWNTGTAIQVIGYLKGKLEGRRRDDEISSSEWTRKEYEFANNSVTKGIEAILGFGRSH